MGFPYSKGLLNALKLHVEVTVLEHLFSIMLQRGLITLAIYIEYGFN